MAVADAPILQARNTGNGAIRLSWLVDPNAVSYKIYRDPTAAPTTQLAAGVTANPYFDTAGANLTDYYFRIKATNGSGDSAYSNEVHILRADTSTRGGSARRVNVVQSVPVPTA